MNSNSDLIPRNGINLAYEEFISQIDKEKISASQETMTRTQKRTLTTFLALCVTFGTPWDQAFMYLPVRFADTPYLIEQMNKDSQEKISQILSKEHKIERN